MGQPQNSGRSCPVCFQRGPACRCGEPPEPRHGEIRNQREETVVGSRIVFLLPGGALTRLPGSCFTQTVGERWCANCHAWVEARGILGNLACSTCHTSWAEPPTPKEP
jgi:hypothetical protein